MSRLFPMQKWHQRQTPCASWNSPLRQPYDLVYPCEELCRYRAQLTCFNLVASKCWPIPNASYTPLVNLDLQGKSGRKSRNNSDFPIAIIPNC